VELEDIRRRFTYHKPDADRAGRHENIRAQCRNLALNLNESLPEGREKSLAITHLEEVMMWSNAALARQKPSASEEVRHAGR
jgi:hypothetical protein